MSNNIVEENPAQQSNTPSGPQGQGAGGGQDKIRKQARQLAYDVRYKVKQSFKDGQKTDPASLKRAFVTQLGKSPAPGPVKLLAKKMLIGEEYDFTDISETVENVVSNTVKKIFAKTIVIDDVDGNPAFEVTDLVSEDKIGERKYKIRVTDKKTGKSYVRMADRAKISELRSNPNISSVEMTGYGTPYEGERKKGSSTAAVKSGKGLAKKDYDGDGKLESPTAEYKGSKDKAIKKAVAKEEVEVVDEKISASGYARAKKYREDQAREKNRRENPQQAAFFREVDKIKAAKAKRKAKAEKNLASNMKKEDVDTFIHNVVQEDIADIIARLEKKRISKGGDPKDSPLPAMKKYHAKKKKVKKGDWIGPPPKKEEVENLEGEQIDEIVGQVVGGTLGATLGAKKLATMGVKGALAQKVAGSAIGAAAGEVLDPFKKNKNKNPVAAGVGGAAGAAAHGVIQKAIKSSYEPEGDNVEEGKLGAAVGGTLGNLAGKAIGGAVAGPAGHKIGKYVGGAAGAAAFAKKGKKGRAAAGGALGTAIPTGMGLGSGLGAALAASHELEGDLVDEKRELVTKKDLVTSLGGAVAGPAGAAIAGGATAGKGRKLKKAAGSAIGAALGSPAGPAGKALGSLVGGKLTDDHVPEGEVIDETYFDTNRRGISTKGGFVKQYNKPGKLSRASLNHERKAKDPELRMSKKELRKSMEDDANYEKKMGRSKPTPSNLKTALKKQRQSTSEEFKKEELDASVQSALDSLNLLDERLGGKGYSRKAAASSVYPGKKGTGDWEDSDRGAGNKAKKRAGGKVEKKSPTYQAYVLNKEHHQKDADGKVIEHGDGTPSSVEEDYYSGTGEKVVARTKKWMDKKGEKGAPGLDAMKARTAEHKAKRGVKEDFIGEVKDVESTDTTGKKIDVMKGKNKITINPNQSEQFNSIKDKIRSILDERSGKNTSKMVEDAEYGYDKEGKSLNPKDKDPKTGETDDKPLGSVEFDGGAVIKPIGDSREMPTAFNLIRNKLRARGMKL